MTDAVQLYAACEWLNEGYFLADRADRRDRFLGLEKRLVGGVTFNPWANLSLDVNAGYAFDREYGTSRNQGVDLEDAVRVEPGAFLGAALRCKF